MFSPVKLAIYSYCSCLKGMAWSTTVIIVVWLTDICCVEDSLLRFGRTILVRCLDPNMKFIVTTEVFTMDNVRWTGLRLLPGRQHKTRGQKDLQKVSSKASTLQSSKLLNDHVTKFWDMLDCFYPLFFESQCRMNFVGIWGSCFGSQVQ